MTHFNKSAQSLTNQTCTRGCGTFRAAAGTVCPGCGAQSKAQANVATEAPGGPPETKDDF